MTRGIIFCVGQDEDGEPLLRMPWILHALANGGDIRHSRFGCPNQGLPGNTKPSGTQLVGACDKVHSERRWLHAALHSVDFPIGGVFGMSAGRSSIVDRQTCKSHWFSIVLIDPDGIGAVILFDDAVSRRKTCQSQRVCFLSLVMLRRVRW